MAFSAEVTGKLGIDTSSVPADLAKGKEAFEKFGQEVQEKAKEHGAGAGGKLTKALEHKLAGAGHLAGALAVALGLNAEKIAEHITSAIVGGSKEAWEEAVKLADENTKVIERLIETRMNPKQLQDKRQKDLQKALEENAGAGQQSKVGKFVESLGGAFGSSWVDNAKRLGQVLHLVKDDATILQEKNAASLKINEADLKIAEEKKQVMDAEKNLALDILASQTESLPHTEKVAALKKQIANFQDSLNSGQLSDLEIVERKRMIQSLQNKLKAEELATTQRQEDKERSLAKLATDRMNAQRKMAMDEEELANRTADRSKLTIAEIATLKPGGPKQVKQRDTSTFGLSAEASDAKKLAQEIEDLQAQAEQLRLTGSRGEADAAFAQIDSKREQLVASGFAKSTEGDQFKQLKETIHKDSVDVQKILTDTNQILQGKFVNQ